MGEYLSKRIEMRREITQRVKRSMFNFIPRIFRIIRGQSSKEPKRLATTPEKPAILNPTFDKNSHPEESKIGIIVKFSINSL